MPGDQSSVKPRSSRVWWPPLNVLQTAASARADRHAPPPGNPTSAAPGAARPPAPRTGGPHPAALRPPGSDRRSAKSRPGHKTPTPPGQSPKDSRPAPSLANGAFEATRPFKPPVSTIQTHTVLNHGRRRTTRRTGRTGGIRTGRAIARRPDPPRLRPTDAIASSSNASMNNMSSFGLMIAPPIGS